MDCNKGEPVSVSTLLLPLHPFQRDSFVSDIFAMNVTMDFSIMAKNKTNKQKEQKQKQKHTPQKMGRGGGGGGELELLCTP